MKDNRIYTLVDVTYQTFFHFISQHVELRMFGRQFHSLVIDRERMSILYAPMHVIPELRDKNLFRRQAHTHLCRVDVMIVQSQGHGVFLIIRIQ
jgi:hypothetical protein